MVLTKAELLGSLQNEVRILLHLATKIDRAKLDYRPTPKQRSTLELLRYLSFMGPTLIQAARHGSFDPGAWTTVQQAAEGRDFDQTLDAISAMSDQYTSLLSDMPDSDFRVEIEMFGRKTTRGAFIGGLLGLASAVILVILSPTVWVKTFGNAAAIFPYDNPALFSMAIAFGGIWLFSVLDRSRSAMNEQAAFGPQYVRSQTGLGAEGAAAH